MKACSPFEPRSERDSLRQKHFYFANIEVIFVQVTRILYYIQPVEANDL